jgi:hypothetical protein
MQFYKQEDRELQKCISSIERFWSDESYEPPENEEHEEELIKTTNNNYEFTDAK